MRLARALLIGALVALATLNTSCASAQESSSKPEDLLSWFASLGFPSTKGRPLVRVKIDANEDTRFRSMFDSHPLPESIDRAFLLSEDETSLSVLAPDLLLHKLPKS